MTRPPISRDMNFATRDYRISARIVAGLAVVSAVLLLVFLGIAITALTGRSEGATLDRQVADLAGRTEKLQAVLNERDRLLKELGNMTALMESRRFSWTSLLTNIEQVFPAGVALDRLQCNPKERSLLLEGRAQSPESLRNLVIGLERSPAFSDSQLRHQSVERGVISFTIGVRYR